MNTVVRYGFRTDPEVDRLSSELAECQMDIITDMLNFMVIITYGLYLTVVEMMDCCEFCCSLDMSYKAVRLSDFGIPKSLFSIAYKSITVFF